MRLLSLLSALIFIAGCGGDGSHASRSNFKPVEASYDLTEPNSLATVINVTDATLHINLGSNPKSLYVVTTSHFDNQPISVNNKKSSRVLNESNETLDSNPKNSDSVVKRVMQFREQTFKLLRVGSSSSDESYERLTPQNRASQGATASFCVDMDSNYNCKRQINATAIRVKSTIATAQGDKSLVIWLQDGLSIKSSSLDNLSDTFLKSGLNNDIYDWETNIYSKEWGDDAKDVDSHLIANDNTIDVLVYNMYNSGVAGFYWPKDNFKKSFLAASNERVMFYVNANLLATDEKETFTTLDHEFQHMIHFYQRAILKDIHDDTWFNEMLSEATEDLLATKIAYKGPRNVDPNDGSAGSGNNKKGRYPSFNAHNTLSLTQWGNGVAHYGKVSAFGTYLLRNYGGAKLLHELMKSSKYDKEALLEATGVDDFHTLIHNWGCAVVLSDKTNIEGIFRYNKGGFFTTSYGDVTYNLGSINFFNYSPKPKFSNSATLDDNANLYTKIGTNLSGTVDIRVYAPKGATISVIAK